MRTWLALPLALCAACGPSVGDGDDDVPAGGDGGQVDAPAVTTDDGGVCTDVIDVVFVLDTSSSMGFVLQQLEQQIGDVVTAANGLAPDAHFGLIAFQDNHKLDDTGPLEQGRVHTSASTLQAAFASYRNVYTRNDRNPGDGPNGPTTQNPICEENALDALYAAAADFPWRENATRVVIVATDDTFLEAPDNYGDRDHDGDTTSTDYPREGNYPARHRYAETVTALQDRRIRVFAFSRMREPGLFDGRCGTERRFPWSQITAGWSTPYQGAEAFPAATDAAQFDVDLVRNGMLSLSATINGVVLDSFCSPPVID